MWIAPANPVTNPDLSVALVYRIIDANGKIWRSAPYIGDIINRADGLDSTTIGNEQWIRIPTLRHLLPDTTAQIELYIGSTDLELFRVFANDPTVDYFDYCPNFDKIGSPLNGGEMGISMADVLAAAGRGREALYTTGNALANDPPPAMRAVTVWRNRAIGVKGTSVYPSQEFEDGYGIRWNDTLRSEWKEGTGEIVGIAAIDWNFCGLLKQDAIGILEGAGPDGMGSGGYVVRTLSTKKGCTNPKSIVNGNDGCYFQDATTKRLCVVTPQMAVDECAPGWFNTSAETINAAMHVESLRQMWFATATTLVVIDYKHRTERCPYGQVYTWTLASFTATVSGMAIVNGVPTLAFDDGTLAQYIDANAYDRTAATDDGVEVNAQQPIPMRLKSGELQPFGLQGMGDICIAQMLGEFIGKHTISMATGSQFTTSGTYVTSDIEEAPEQVGTRPPDCQRVQSMWFDIHEVAMTEESGAKTLNKGFKFVGFAMEVQPRGRAQRLNLGRII
jgi:hypothetical protein